MTTAQLQSRVLIRLGEDPSLVPGNQFYNAQEVLNALNAVQRMFVLLTLCLETTASMTLTASGGKVPTFHQMLQQFSDWLLPLRVRSAAGTKVRPSRLADLAALDASWSTSPGALLRYSLIGFDFLAIYQQPAATTSISITYAQCPVVMDATSTPQIPIEFHQALIDGAIPLLRTKEGGQEWQKTLWMWDRFIDSAQKMADYVRRRNKEQGYDFIPVELRRFDRSKLLMEAATING